MRNISKSMSLLCGVVVSLVLILSSCSPNSSNSNSAEKSVLNIGATLEPTGLDPTTVNGAGTPYALLYNVYETLVKLDGNGQMKPLLAKSWQVSADGLTYTFKLNQAAKFASGHKVDAAAVVGSITRLMQGKGTAVVNDQMAVVKSVKAKDPYTVMVSLKYPDNFWLYNMTSTAGIIFDPDGINTLATKPAGSGPYLFKEHKKGESLSLVANPKYWNKKAHFKLINFRYYTDPTAMVTAMLSRQLDIVSNLTAVQAIDQFKDKSRFSISEGTSSGEVILGFNHERAPFKNIQLRKAINYAINRKALLKSVWNGKGTLIGTMVAPTDPWFEKDLAKAYPFDPKKAKELLKQAGQTSLSLKLKVPSNLKYATEAAKVVASQLKDIGINVAIEELEFSRWLDVVYKKADYDMTIISHVEPRDLGNWAKPSYYWRYDNKNFQKAYNQAIQGKASDLKETMKKAARILSDDAVADFLWSMPNIVVTTNKIHGVPANQTTLSFDLTDVVFK